MTEPADLETRIDYLLRAMAKLEGDVEALREQQHRVADRLNVLWLWYEALKQKGKTKNG